jgi:hypothetical protein
MTAPIVFTAAMIRELDHDPQRFMRNFGRQRDGNGFGYPQESLALWVPRSLSHC